jgi:PadR family transcriptional regulator, regulatory protein PadR
LILKVKVFFRRLKRNARQRQDDAGGARLALGKVAWTLYFLRFWQAGISGRSSMVECLLMSREPYRNRIELLQGTLDLLILQTLQWGPRHGHGIGLAIRAGSEDALQVEHGSLYPALHRLERSGWLSSEWKASDAGRRAKYYKLTPRGRKELLERQSRWKQLVRAVARTMKPIQE